MGLGTEVLFVVARGCGEVVQAEYYELEAFIAPSVLSILDFQPHLISRELGNCGWCSSQSWVAMLWYS